MICYKDRTFCADDVVTHSCGRELTKEDEERAEKLRLPVAYGSFCAVKEDTAVLDRIAVSLEDNNK